MPQLDNNHKFSQSEKKGVYRAIFERRDIRREFLPKSISQRILMRLLKAAHHAGSVGFMQPWNFIVIKDRWVKAKVKEIFLRENLKARMHYRGDRRKKYDAMKLEGIEEAPINICVTCDSSRGGRHVLGRNTMRQTDIFSTCCAIQNLWLAARSEGIGIGWVSILNNRLLKKFLKIPGRIRPMAYLCLGYVSSFPKRPMLQAAGWARRLSLKKLIHWDIWNNSSWRKEKLF